MFHIMTLVPLIYIILSNSLRPVLKNATLTQFETSVPGSDGVKKTSIILRHDTHTYS